MKYPLSDKKIMKYLNLPRSTRIGVLKEMPLESVLNGEVKNDKVAVLELLTMKEKTS